MKSMLLCTFSHNTNVRLTTDYIFQNYTLERNSIYIFHNDEDRHETYLTYNVIGADHFIENTILIHRKKETNTLYTINALNEIIKRSNNGLLDKTFILDWELYTNSMLLSNEQEVRIVPLILNRIVKR